MAYLSAPVMAPPCLAYLFGFSARSSTAYQATSEGTVTRGVNVGLEINSRGLALVNDNVGPISQYTRRELERLGIPLPETLRHPVDAAERDFQSAHLIVALKEAEHRPLMQSRFPAWVERVEYWHVHDLDFAQASDALPQVRSHVEQLVRRLKNSFPPLTNSDSGK